MWWTCSTTANFAANVKDSINNSKLISLLLCIITLQKRTFTVHHRFSRVLVSAARISFLSTPTTQHWYQSAAKTFRLSYNHGNVLWLIKTTYLKIANFHCILRFFLKGKIFKPARRKKEKKPKQNLQNFNAVALHRLQDWESTWPAGRSVGSSYCRNRALPCFSLSKRKTQKSWKTAIDGKQLIKLLVTSAAGKPDTNSLKLLM